MGQDGGEVIDKGNDKGQLLSQVEKVEEVLKDVGEVSRGESGTQSPVKRVSADSAYHDTRQLVELEGRNIKTYVPESHSERRPTGVSDGFLARDFDYDVDADVMICPAGHTMARRGMNTGKTAVAYEAKKATCHACRFKSKCCPKTKGGRSVSRPIYEEVKEIAKRVKSDEGLRYRNARKVTMEGAFARVKELLHWKRWRTWGREGAQVEALWRQITHNLLLLIGQ